MCLRGHEVTGLPVAATYRSLFLGTETAGPSGLDAGDRWSAADIASYVERALELFGLGRLMLGNDWPVANLGGGYARVWQETGRVPGRLSQDERDRILGGTAVAFYRPAIGDGHQHMR